MEDSYGQHGWREFYQNRENILSEFDKILKQTKNRPIQVAHGIGVEAYLRKWLSEFLPKKFGVTSGYIIPNLYDDSSTIYHYDIIIYNQLDSPILWTEGNEDQKEQGKFRAIPAKYVVSVYEVKARLTKSDVIESLKKLNQTEAFADQLHPFYTCGIIFIDLKIKDVNKKSILKELLKSENIHGFIGGMILRFEGDDTCTGNINLLPIENNPDEDNINLIPLAKSINEIDIYSTEDGNIKVSGQGAGVKLVKTGDNRYSISKSYSVIDHNNNFVLRLSWSRTNFADFCIDLLSNLEGLTYNDKRRPSFGQIFDNLEKKKAPLQTKIQENGKPFLNLQIYKGRESEIRIDTSEKESSSILTIPVLLENYGEFDITFSDDSFESKLKLPAGKSAIKESSYKINSEKEKIKIPYRVVYYEDNSNKKFYSIEKNIVFNNGEAELE